MFENNKKWYVRAAFRGGPTVYSRAVYQRGISSRRRSERTADGDGLFARRYSERPADSEAVFSRRCMERPAVSESCAERRGGVLGLAKRRVWKTE
jgi:hypothetical protein